MAGAAPRQGTFTRDLRINASRSAPSSDDTSVVRSPTNHPSNVGPGASAFAEPVALAHTRQRREAQQLLGPRPPAPPFGSPQCVPSVASPSHAYTGSPAFGSDKGTAKSPLSPTSMRRSRSIFAPSNLQKTLGWLAGGMILLFFVCSLYSSAKASQVPESQPSSVCEAQYDTLISRTNAAHHSVHEGEHGDFPVRSASASIAIVTMADTRSVPLPKNLAYLSDIKPGSVVNILDVVWRNRQEYADRHGYTLVNGTEFVGTERPPSWYKLKIVESVIDDYDWVFYLDPDAWITNPEIPLEAVLPVPGGPDFVVTEDASGANAGSWIIRNSDWSREFLAEWWSMDSFIRPHGDTKSGDNDALKHYIASMNPHERVRRIAVPPQCALNSYLWRPSLRQWLRWLTSNRKVHAGIWRPGHLLVHLAGWDNYKGLMRLQKQVVNPHDPTGHSSSGLPLATLSRKHLGSDWHPSDTAESSSSDAGSATIAADSRDSKTSASDGNALGGKGAADIAAASLRRRASSLLSNAAKLQNATTTLPSPPPKGRNSNSPTPTKGSGGGVPKNGVPAQGKPTTPTIPTSLRAKPLVDTLTTTTPGDSDNDYNEDSDDPEHSGDYTIATDAEIADLGLHPEEEDSDAEDSEMLDEVFGSGGRSREEQSDEDMAGSGDAEEHTHTFKHHHHHVHTRPRPLPPGNHTRTQKEFTHDNTIVTLEHGSEDPEDEHKDALGETEHGAEHSDDERDADLVMEIADELAGILKEHKQKNKQAGISGTRDSPEERGRRGIGADVWAITEDSVPIEQDEFLGFPGDDSALTRGTTSHTTRNAPDVEDESEMNDNTEEAEGGRGVTGMQADRMSHLLRNANRMAGAGAGVPATPSMHDVHDAQQQNPKFLDRQQQRSDRSLLHVSDPLPSLGDQNNQEVASSGTDETSLSMLSSTTTSTTTASVVVPDAELSAHSDLSDPSDNNIQSSLSSQTHSSTTSMLFFRSDSKRSEASGTEASSNAAKQTLLQRLYACMQPLLHLRSAATEHSTSNYFLSQSTLRFGADQSASSHSNLPTAILQSLQNLWPFPSQQHSTERQQQPKPDDSNRNDRHKNNDDADATLSSLPATLQHAVGRSHEALQQYVKPAVVQANTEPEHSAETPDDVEVQEIFEQLVTITKSLTLDEAVSVPEPHSSSQSSSRRHSSILDSMSTDDIDALEELTQLSSPEAQQQLLLVR